MPSAPRRADHGSSCQPVSGTVSMCPDSAMPPHRAAMRHQRALRHAGVVGVVDALDVEAGECRFDPVGDRQVGDEAAAVERRRSRARDDDVAGEIGHHAMRDHRSGGGPASSRPRHRRPGPMRRGGRPASNRRAGCGPARADTAAPRRRRRPRQGFPCVLVPGNRRIRHTARRRHRPRSTRRPVPHNGSGRRHPWRPRRSADADACSGSRTDGPSTGRHRLAAAARCRCHWAVPSA